MSYKIVIETTDNHTQAQNRLDMLLQNKIASKIRSIGIQNGALYSVETNPYAEKKYALEHVDKIKKQLGIKNAFITANN